MRPPLSEMEVRLRLRGAEPITPITHRALQSSKGGDWAADLQRDGPGHGKQHVSKVCRKQLPVTVPNSLPSILTVFSPVVRTAVWHTEGEQYWSHWDEWSSSSHSSLSRWRRRWTRWAWEDQQHLDCSQILSWLYLNIDLFLRSQKYIKINVVQYQIITLYFPICVFIIAPYRYDLQKTI